MISGDLTHHGEHQAFEFLRAQLERIPFQTHLVLGNHDLRAEFQRTFPKVPRDAHGLTQYAVQTTAGVFIIGDTLQEGTHIGWYDAQRLD